MPQSPAAPAATPNGHPLPADNLNIQELELAAVLTNGAKLHRDCQALLSLEHVAGLRTTLLLLAFKQ